MKLLVVETEGKASQVSSLLRKMGEEDIHVVSTNGRYMDLPKSSLGITKNLSLHWKVSNPQSFSKLKRDIQKSDEVISITDYSPEGELISLHLKTTSEISSKAFKRSRVSCLSPESIKEAIDSSGYDINESLAYSFVARDVADRLIRFSLSPPISSILQRDVELSYFLPILSEVGKRERKIRRFSSSPSFDVRALLTDGTVVSRTVYSEPEAERLAKSIESANLVYSTAKKASVVPGAFTTHQLLSFCFRRYGISALSCLEICSSLYARGLISYPFTTESCLPDSIVSTIRSFIGTRLSSSYLSPAPSFVGSGDSFGIHPTNFNTEPSGASLRKVEKDIYSAIWFRSAGSQGTNALFSCSSVDVCDEENNILCSSSGVTVDQPGWHQLSGRLFEPVLSAIDPDSKIEEVSIVPGTTRPPSRLNQNSIIDWMSENFFGSPHNYALALRWMSATGYVEFSGGGVAALTPKGETVLTSVKRSFPDLLDPDMAAQIEEDIKFVLEGRDISDFIKEYMGITESMVSSCKVKKLRPNFLSPSALKLQVLLSKSGKPYAQDSSGWTCYVAFDEKGQMTKVTE